MTGRLPRVVDRPILPGFGMWRLLLVGLALLAVTQWASFWTKSQGARRTSSPGRSPWLLAAGLAFILVVEAEQLVICSSASVVTGGHRGGGRHVNLVPDR